MGWLGKIISGRLMMVVYGAAVVALLAYFTQIKVLKTKISNRDTTIDELATDLSEARVHILNQNTEVDRLAAAGAEAKAHNTTVVEANQRLQSKADKTTRRATTRLRAATMNNTCATQDLPESVKNEF